MEVKEESSKTARVSSLVQAITACLRCAASVVAILNRLTGTFTGLLDFRARYIILLLILSSLCGLGLWVLVAKHQCPSHVKKIV